jgi:sulfide dehydrogenase cytochrome subunit
MDRRSHRRSVPCLRALPSTRRARAAAAGGVLCLLLLAATARGGQQAPPPGAESCTGCHAPAALAVSLPAIEGRPAAELAAALRAFRSGERHATVMDRIARGFSVEELDAIAAWFAEPRR